MESDWPATTQETDDMLGRLGLERGDTVPGYAGRAFRLSGDRDLSASFLLVNTFQEALVSLHALGNGQAPEVQRVYQETTEELAAQHGAPTKDYDRRRPPSEASHWLLGPARVSLYCHADYQSAAMTIQLAIEHLERTAASDEEDDD